MMREWQICSLYIASSMLQPIGMVVLPKCHFAPLLIGQCGWYEWVGKGVVEEAGWSWLLPGGRPVGSEAAEQHPSATHKHQNQKKTFFSHPGCDPDLGKTSVMQSSNPFSLWWMIMYCPIWSILTSCGNKSDDSDKDDTYIRAQCSTIVQFPPPVPCFHLINLIVGSKHWHH